MQSIPAASAVDLTVYHHGAPGRPPIDPPARAPHAARWHRAGEPAPWYAAGTREAMWAELRRHLPLGVDLREVFRLVVTAEVSARVLDLTGDAARRAVGVTLADLTGEDWKPCQELAALAAAHGYDGVLGPSAALAGDTTLVVLRPALHRVHVVSAIVERGPADP